MGKFAKISAAVLIVASALFLFAPTFRQGVRLTVSSWRQSDGLSSFSSGSSWTAGMRSLGAKAEANRDAETLAFVAMQMLYDSQHLAQRDKFADEAVQWNADLTWIYYPILSVDGLRMPPTSSDARDPNDARWMARLEAWDPNNAAVYARAASFYMPQGVRGLNPQADRALLASSTHWLSDMDKAFSATEYDSYLSRKAALDREVRQRHGLDDPSRMLLDMMFYPRFENFDFDLYATDFLLKAGEDFEAKGDISHAEENYWKVAHLGELMQLRDDSDPTSFVASELELSADPRLEAIFEKTGNSSAAKLVAYQAALARHFKSLIMEKDRTDGLRSNLNVFDAWVTQLSLLAMALSLVLIVSCGMYFLIRRMLGTEGAGLKRVFSAVGVVGTALLFVSSIAMYFSYAPYADAFQRYLATADPLNARESLLRFWGLGELPSGLYSWFYGLTFRLYLWYSVIAVGAAIIVWIVCRYLMRTFRHSAPMQPAD